MLQSLLYPRAGWRVFLFGRSLPRDGFVSLKVNCDASLKGSSAVAACVVRDANGHKIRGSRSIMLVERGSCCASEVISYCTK